MKNYISLQLLNLILYIHLVVSPFQGKIVCDFLEKLNNELIPDPGSQIIMKFNDKVILLNIIKFSQIFSLAQVIFISKFLYKCD